MLIRNWKRWALLPMAIWKGKKPASASLTQSYGRPPLRQLPTVRSTRCMIHIRRSAAVPLLLMQFGEVVFGGVGSGLYGMLVFVIIAVFIAGLMVGRTPEYLGKKIGTFEMKMAAVAILVMPITVLFFTALAVLHPSGLAGLLNHGPHGFSEILCLYLGGEQ